MQPQLTPIYLKFPSKLKDKLKKEAKKNRVSMVKFITDAVELALNSKPWLSILPDLIPQGYKTPGTFNL